MTTDPRVSVAPCYRDSANGVRYVRNAHRHDCDDSDCRGCRPCAERNHCTFKPNCTWHVGEGELTCGRCLAGVRRNLRWAEALAALLMPAAMSDGLGSEAANLAGPVADPEALMWRRVTLARNGTPWEAIEDEDDRNPHRLIGTWAQMLTEDYDHDMPANASLTWCVAYLDRNLARVAHDERQDFPLLGRELRKCVQHLESVLHNDTRPERGAPCPTCRDAGAVVRLRREFAHWCEDDDCERLHFDDDSGDVWRCPRNDQHWWTQQGYADLLEARSA